LSGAKPIRGIDGFRRASARLNPSYGFLGTIPIGVKV
jgi:hypothetical protein